MMFESDVLKHLTVEELYETVLIHGNGICFARTTCETETYRVRKRETNLDYREMCRCLCELYRRNLLPMKHYDLRQLLDLTPKCELCHKNVTQEGYCGYHQSIYARNDVRCVNCAPANYHRMTENTYDAALAWTFYQMMENTNTMFDEIKEALDMLRLAKTVLDDSVQ